jgi:hypothetical protein
LLINALKGFLCLDANVSKSPLFFRNSITVCFMVAKAKNSLMIMTLCVNFKDGLEPNFVSVYNSAVNLFNQIIILNL